MEIPEFCLSFERPIYELESQIGEMDGKAAHAPELRETLTRLRRELIELKKNVYANLTPWEIVEAARHPQRPLTGDYLELVFEEFVELHGDRFFGDDHAMKTGWAKLDGQKVMVIGHHKGHGLQEKNECNFGCAHPEGYRKAMLKMKLAAKFHMPIICLIDTPGAWPGIDAEERGQAWVIAQSMFLMSQLATPIICIVIAEGGSGGALGIGVGDKIAMLRNSYYSVISPEGCAGILWKSGEYKKEAASALKMTAKDLLELKIVDDVIEEPLGGAHRDVHLMASNLKMYLKNSLRELLRIPADKLVERRYQKFRKFGQFLEVAQSQAQQTAPPDDVANVPESVLA